MGLQNDLAMNTFKKDANVNKCTYCCTEYRIFKALQTFILHMGADCGEKGETKMKSGCGTNGMSVEIFFCIDGFVSAGSPVTQKKEKYTQMIVTFVLISGKKCQ